MSTTDISDVEDYYFQVILDNPESRYGLAPVPSLEVPLTLGGVLYSYVVVSFDASSLHQWAEMSGCPSHLTGKDGTLIILCKNLETLIDLLVVPSFEAELFPSTGVLVNGVWVSVY